MDTNSYNLNGAGGGAVTVVFDALTDGPDDIANFDVLTDTLQFSLGAFTGLSATGAIAADQFLVAADVSAAGGTGFTGDHRFLYNNASGANAGDLFYDADGSGAGEAVLIATMQTVPGLTADDIIMIA